MNRNKLLILVILYFGFISLGLPDQSLGIAWTEMRRFFNKPLDAAGVLISMTAILGAVSAISSGWLIRRFSIIFILIASCVLTVLGLLGYALSPSWLLLVAATVPQGFGAGAIDAVLNNYVARNYSSRQMNWLHACWGIGASLGPAIMTFAVVHWSWRSGYLVLAAIQIALIGLFISSRKLWKTPQMTEAPNDIKNLPSPKFFSAAPLLSLSFFLVYTSVEFGVGIWFFSVMTDSYEIAVSVAGSLTVTYWASMMIGRFGVGIIANQLGNRRIIFYGNLCALTGAFLLFFNNQYLILSGLILCGLGFSGLYPSMMHETPRRFESRFSATLTGYQAAAGSLGVALLAPLIGVIITRTSLSSYVPLMILQILILLAVSQRLNRLTSR